MMRVDVIIPAYNEEENIELTLQTLRHQSWLERIYVIDDGSIDQTAKVASKYADEVFRFHLNQGKAAAAITGLRQARGEYVMLLDADLRSTAKEASKLLSPLLKKEADVTIAEFPITLNGKGLGFMKRRAQQVLFRQFYVKLFSPLSGQRAFHRKWVNYLSEDVRDSRFGFEMACNFDFLSRGAVIKEVPTFMEHHAYGKTIHGFLHRSKQWYEMERFLWQRTSGNLY
ncbi:glycosyltransferase family 2 protein [Alteribacter populi]|uniref:glycosyltransferase family 2 protein n=1 Tax=Alteribacter populi TaxID=2011011 RepID=UPI000BBA956B|nr:glycosyltransferase family 2 protein [Alteribacter populi]